MPVVIVDDKAVRFTSFTEFQQGVADMFKLGQCCRDNWCFDPVTKDGAIVAVFYAIPK